jgi:HK97 gp10 family phage protein
MAFEKRSTLEGVAVLTKQLKALEQLEQGQVLKRGVKAGINVALKYARQNIPVGGGVTPSGRPTVTHLTYQGRRVSAGFARSQLRTGASINKTKDIADGILTTTKEGFYILNFVELGTRYQRAQPWIRKSLLQARDEAELALANSILLGIDNAVKSA